MKSNEIVYLAIGTFLGVAGMFYQIDAPKMDKCLTYKVASKSVTSYALKPPPAPEPETVIIKEKCPASSVSQKAENDTQADLSVADETQRPRRHRRHWRHYWRRH